MKLEFLGAARTVTGSRTLVQHGKKKFLVDCGLFQGPKERRLMNWNPFIDARSVDAVILTHAHIDHSGYLPKLVREGFRGPIYCSPGTADLCKILLLDSAHLQEEDAEYANRSRHSRHNPALPLYTVKDAEAALRLLEPVERDAWFTLGDDLSLRYLRSGHIIGSSFAQLATHVGNGVRMITFSGDIGNGRSFTLRPPVTVAETDYLVMESTYGDRVQPHSDTLEEVEQIVNRVLDRGGVLLIPAFTVGRTQDVLYVIQQLQDQKRIPHVPVYVDSPMAANATKIFMAHPEDHVLANDPDGFKAPITPSRFQSILDTNDSKRLNQMDEPMIIISASGMLSGGRIMHHLKTRLPGEKNGVLIVGYQAEGTKGRLLQAGLRELRIHHQPVEVRAEICTIESLSAHADSNDIMEWLKQVKKAPELTFLNHGEPTATEALAERIRRELGWKVTIPAQGESFEIPAF